MRKLLAGEPIPMKSKLTPLNVFLDESNIIRIFSKDLGFGSWIKDLSPFDYAREFADKIDIPDNFELTQPRHTVRRRNVNFDYEARDDPTEDPTLKYKTDILGRYIR
ncbi:hypothetical protein TNCV_1622971 [Trichonephila clavipes]|nr:hypothetical protein TNCV_1622971 [Trichonephila clavipes]